MCIHCDKNVDDFWLDRIRHEEIPEKREEFPVKLTSFDEAAERLRKEMQ